MTGRTFLDTNVLVYAFDGANRAKQVRAQEILEAAIEDGQAMTSTQVLAEFYVTVVRKLDAPLTEVEAERAVRSPAMLPVVQHDPPLVLTAIASSRRYRISLWDALIIESARIGGCHRVLTEDLQDGGEYDGLVVENPFKGL